jgi:hypothetical protein
VQVLVSVCEGGAGLTQIQQQKPNSTQHV